MSTLLARDSWTWWLVILGAMLAYMANKPPVTQWLYADWLEAVAFLVATVAGKLSTSPLASQRELEEGTRTLTRAVRIRTPEDQG